VAVRVGGGVVISGLKLGRMAGEVKMGLDPRGSGGL